MPANGRWDLTRSFKGLMNNSTKQSYPSETNNFSGSQEIPRILLKRMVHNSSNNCSPLFRTLSQMNPFYVFPKDCFKNGSNAILPSAPKSTKCSLCFRVSSIPTGATCLAHPILPDCVTRILFGEEYKSWRPSLHNLRLSPVICTS